MLFTYHQDHTFWLKCSFQTYSHWDQDLVLRVRLEVDLSKWFLLCLRNIPTVLSSLEQIKILIFKYSQMEKLGKVDLAYKSFTYILDACKFLFQSPIKFDTKSHTINSIVMQESKWKNIMNHQDSGLTILLVHFTPSQATLLLTLLSSLQKNCLSRPYTRTWWHLLCSSYLFVVWSLYWL